jgi:hypothetical protein
VRLSLPIVAIVSLLAAKSVVAETVDCDALSFTVSISANSVTQTINPNQGARCRLTGGPAQTPYVASVLPSSFSWNSDLSFTANPTTDSGSTVGNGSATWRVGGTVTATTPLAAGSYTTNLTVRFTIGGTNYDGTLTVNVTVTWPLAGSATRSLAFGRIGRSAAAGTVTVTADGVRSSTGAVQLISSTVTSGQITITQGVPGRTLNVSYPASVTLSSGGATMTVDNFVAAGSPTSIVTDYNNGTGTFTVGGRLNVNANQASGTYTGVVPVTISYP